jgi:hypothetical protein
MTSAELPPPEPLPLDVAVGGADPDPAVEPEPDTPEEEYSNVGDVEGDGSGDIEGDDEALEPGAMQQSSINDPQLIVAVKRVPLGWNQERELMQLHRCQQCPFIVRLFGFVDDGSEHCSYVMEWAEGGDLGVMLAVSNWGDGERKDPGAGVKYNPRHTRTIDADAG